MRLVRGTCAYCGADHNNEHAKDCLTNLPASFDLLGKAWVAGYEGKPFVPHTPEEIEAYEMGKRCIRHLDDLFAAA